jgi:molybdopterin synthase catalytic subunit
MEEDRVFVLLTHDPLNPSHAMDLVRSPEAGAIVLFAGTTRNNFQGNPFTTPSKALTFEGKTVIHLDYEAYPEMAIPSLKKIATLAKRKWALFGVAVTHRLGRVPIGEESILIAVSAAHRRAGWDAAEWILEEVKAKTEIWKRESYADSSQEPVWKENKDVSK